MNPSRIIPISLFAALFLPLAACNQTMPSLPSGDAPAEIAAESVAPVAAPQTANLTAPTLYFSSRTFYNTADLRRNNGQYSSIALTAAGNSVIAYYDGVRNDPQDHTGPYGNGDLKLVVCSNPMCINPVITTVDRGHIYTDDAGRGVSMVLDAKGFPVISYFERGTGLKLAHCGDATCTSRNSINSIKVMPLERATDYGNTSLVLDLNGNPVISFVMKNGTSSGIGLARCGDANCSSRSIQYENLGSGQYASLVLDMKGNPVISYYDDRRGDLNIVRCDNFDCSLRGIRRHTVDSAGDVGQYSSLGLLPVRDLKTGAVTGQRPFMSYYDATNGDLKIAFCGNAYCSSGNITGVVDSQGDVGQMTSLKVASDGSPVISYFDATNKDLKLVYCDRGDYQPLAKVPVVTAPCQETQSNVVLTLDSVGDVGQNSSLALDANNKPVISYYQATYASLRVIRGQ